MTSIHPFKAILPISGLEYEIKNKFVFYSHKKFNFGIENHKKKFTYINELLKQNLLHKNTCDNFYCCRVSNKYISVIGLIALVNSDLVDKTIFKHEKCINIKEELYLDTFKKDKIQISPIILIHETNFLINRSLNNVINKDHPFFTIRDDEYKYEMWSIADSSLYKDLYGSISSFLVADGHHRLSSISALGKNKFVTAFLTSADHIKSANIYREYTEVSSLSKKELFLFLNDRFGLISSPNIEKDYLFNNFLFKLDSNIYKIKHNTNDYTKRNILEFLDKSINYNNKGINFCNHPYNQDNNLLLNSKRDVAIIIPAHIIKIKKEPLYPPHSTLFYPKLPEGLVSFNIE